MRTLTLYIGSSFIRHFLLILSILGFLFTFIEFLAQLDDVGRGQYRLEDACLFVILTLPGRLVDLIPGSTLLGGIIALGLLADHNELLAMQAGGVSVPRICWLVLAAATIPMFGAGAMAEYIVPPLEQKARTQRLVALSETDITFTRGGFWARNGPYFIHVRKTHLGGIPVDVDIFEWDQEGRLHMFTHAQNANFLKGKGWVLTDVEQKTVEDEGMRTRQLYAITLEPFLSAEQMAIQEFPPDTLSPSDLYEYTKALETRGENADQYQLVLWQKLSVPFLTAAIVLLSLTFVFGPTRGITAGYRIMMGSIIGIALYLLNQILGHLGIFLGLNPVLTTFTPVAVILCLALWLLSRGPK